MISKQKYAGSYLGIVWAFIQPIVTILVYWFVFSVGLKAGTVSDYPFVLYLVSGIVPVVFLPGCVKRWNQCTD